MNRFDGSFHDGLGGVLDNEESEEVVDDVGLAILFGADQLTVQVSFAFSSISNSFIGAERDIPGDGSGKFLVAFGSSCWGQGEGEGGLHWIFHGVIEGFIIEGSI